MDIHPTRSIYEKWSDRKKLDAFAKTPGVIAIGECGLDYHYKREEQHRLQQHIWFLYQLDLAWRLKKLGYHFGIGGSLLQQEERAGALWEVVKHIPLDKILVETDAPFILPYCRDVIQPKLLRRASRQLQLCW